MEQAAGNHRDRIFDDPKIREQAFPDPKKEYILLAYESRKLNGMAEANNENLLIQEIYNHLDKNVWYIYFRWILANNFAKGKKFIKSPRLCNIVTTILAVPPTFVNNILNHTGKDQKWKKHFKNFKFVMKKNH